jgi:ABC-type branched-subunit amino acid transport system permease subunit
VLHIGVVRAEVAHEVPLLLGDTGSTTNGPVVCPVVGATRTVTHTVCGAVMDFIALQSVVLIVLTLFLQEGFQTVVVYSLLQTGGVNEVKFLIGDAEEVGLMALHRPPKLTHMLVNSISEMVVVLGLWVVLRGVIGKSLDRLTGIADKQACHVVLLEWTRFTSPV